MTVQVRIREGLTDRIRKVTGLNSDDALARLMDVSRASIARIKKGEQPSGEFMALFCTTFGLGLGEAFEIHEVAEEA